jgi:hypothetical protein
MDEPLYRRPEPGEAAPRNRVRVFEARVRVPLCNDCARELVRETEEAGAERSTRPGLGNFYEDGSSRPWYLFRFGEMYVEREKGVLFSAFPERAPEECVRCGADDVTLWRERYGEREGAEEGS